MEYIAVKQAAERWGISVRRVQIYCGEGRIPGARKFGNYWMLPADAQKPDHLRRQQLLTAGRETAASGILLTGQYRFASGEADAYLQSLHNPLEQRQLEAEFHYFRGKYTAVLQQTLAVQEDTFKISRQFIIALAAVCAGDRPAFQQVWEQLFTCKEGEGDQQPILLELAQAAIAVSMYVPAFCPDWLQRGELNLLPPDARMFAFYPYLKYLSVLGRYREIALIAQTLLNLSQPSSYTITEIYLYLMRSYACAALGELDAAEKFIRIAMDLALPDRFVAPFAEFVIPLYGCIEKCLQQFHPDFHDQVMTLWENTWKNWVTFHNLLSGNEITLALTPREYQIATYARAGLNNREIARRLNLSVNTVKTYLKIVYEKLAVNKRSSLDRYIL